MLTNADTAKITVEEFKNKPDTKTKKRVNNLLNRASDKIFIAAKKGKTHIRFRVWIFNPTVEEFFKNGLEYLGFYVTIYSISFNFYEFKISWDK